MRDDEREPRRAQLLYLEDEVLIAFDIAAFLEELDVGDVTTAHKLKSAWMAIENKRFDLALLDINVDRRQTSFEIGSHLREAGCTVIYASGNGCDAASLRGDGYHFVDKPFNHTDLERLIRDCLEARTASA